MPTVALKAHFDGQHILLDESYPLPPESRLMVLVLPDPQGAEQNDWYALAASGLNQAYGADEPEYALSDSRQNP